MASARTHFTMIPNEQLQQRLSISRGAKDLLHVLLSYAWGYNFCFPSQKRLAEGVQCSPDSIQRYTRELVEAGYIRTKRRYGTSTVYTLLDKAPSFGGETPTCRNLQGVHTATCGPKQKKKKKTQQQTATPGPSPEDAAVLSPSAQEEPQPVSSQPEPATTTPSSEAPLFDTAAPPQDTEPPALEPDPDAIQSLTELGVDRATAIELATEYPDRIEPQIAALPYRHATINRVGMLVKSIRENWSLPLPLQRKYKLAAAKIAAAKEEAAAKAQVVAQLQAEEEKAKEAATTLAALPLERQEEIEIHARQWALIQCAKFGREDGSSSYLRWFSGARDTLLAGQPLDGD